MLKKKMLFAAVGGILMVAPFAWGVQENFTIGEIGGSELKIGLGSRAVAMGETFVGLADDVNSTAWNPAGLAQINNVQVGFMHSMYLEDTSIEYLAYAQKLFSGAALGAYVTYLNFGTMEKIDETATTVGEFTPMALTAAVGYGQWLLPGLAVGGALKMISQTIDVQSYTAVAVDVGGLFQPGIQGLQFGLAVQNLGTQLGDATLPMNAKAGVAYALPVHAGPKVVWTVLADVNVPFGDTNYTSLNLGTELWYQKMIALRVGYKIKDSGGLGGTTGLTAGVGGQLPISPAFNLGLDYALVSFGDFGYTHQVMITAGF